MEATLNADLAVPAGSAAVFLWRTACARPITRGKWTCTPCATWTWSVNAGEFVVLLGPSGSGKSTLLNILGGLDVPTSGDVRFGEHQLTGASEADLTTYRREHVGFVFQFYNLIPSLTVRENVALVTDIAPHPMPIDEAIDRVGLTPRRDHFPAQLSGGEQQRVAIARAIVKRPEVLLCDEPTGALDYTTGKLVLETIARINAELGTTTDCDHPQRRHFGDGRPRDRAGRWTHPAHRAQPAQGVAVGAELVKRDPPLRAPRAPSSGHPQWTGKAGSTGVVELERFLRGAPRQTRHGWPP